MSPPFAETSRAPLEMHGEVEFEGVLGHFRDGGIAGIALVRACGSFAFPSRSVSLGLSHRLPSRSCFEKSSGDPTRRALCPAAGRRCLRLSREAAPAPRHRSLSTDRALMEQAFRARLGASASFVWKSKSPGMFERTASMRERPPSPTTAARRQWRTSTEVGTRSLRDRRLRPAPVDDRRCSLFSSSFLKTTQGACTVHDGTILFSVKTMFAAELQNGFQFQCESVAILEWGIVFFPFIQDGDERGRSSNVNRPKPPVAKNGEESRVSEEACLLRSQATRVRRDHSRVQIFTFL